MAKIITLLFSIFISIKAPVQARGIDASVDINRAFDQVTNAVTGLASGFGSIHHNLDRGDLTRRVANMFSGDGYNVMVLKTENVSLGDYGGRIQRGVTVQTGCHCFVWCQTCTFEVLVAPKGYKWSATNNGDGGYINWAFGGRYTRDGSTVRFY